MTRSNKFDLQLYFDEETVSFCLFIILFVAFFIFLISNSFFLSGVAFGWWGYYYQAQDYVAVIFYVLAILNFLALGSCIRLRAVKK